MKKIIAFTVMCAILFSQANVKYEDAGSFHTINAIQTNQAAIMVRAESADGMSRYNTMCGSADGVSEYNPIGGSAATSDVSEKTQTEDLSGSSANESENWNISTSAYEEGAASDISISGVSVSGGNAGGKVTVAFTVTGKQNDKKKYEVDSITQVYPVIEESFPFETDDAAYQVTTGTGNTLQCSYTFKVKANVQTEYYPVNFMVVYGRKNTTGGTADYSGKDYAVTKSLSVSLTEKKTTEAPASTEAYEEMKDLTIAVDKTPQGTYGGNCNIHFTVKSSLYKITGVTPMIADDFPFETTGDAYKTITSKGKNKISCDYNFKVRSDVATGYQPVTFQITYVKNKTTLTTTRSVSVKLTGKKEKQEKEKSDSKTSKPRVRIASYELDKSKIIPGKPFHLQLKMKNYAKTAVSNVMFTVENENGEFLPVDGTGSVYQDSIAAGQSVDVTFALKPANHLEENFYKLVLKTEYENSKGTEYVVEENLYIPIQLEQRMSITDVFLTESSVELGNTAEISAVVNNLGGGTLYNVTARTEDKYLQGASTYVGNIESGESGYIDLLAKAGAVTPGAQELNKLIISYEDKEGNIYEQEETFQIAVTEPVYKNLEKVKESKDYGNTIGTVLKVAGGAGIVAVVVFLRMRRKKRKREMLEEF